MIYVIATMTIKPGSLPVLLPAIKAVTEATAKEDGFISYDLHQNVLKPETLVFVEKWASREALTAHSQQPHLKAWREAGADHVLSRVIEVVHPDKVETF